MLITRVRPSRFMATAMALWAILSTLTAVAKDFKGLLVTRFLLGITEAPFYPGALYMLATFYTRREIATRISILFTANICGTAFAGLIAIGVFQMNQTAGITGWRWLFFIQGGITFVISVASAFILPDEPLQTRWLSEDEQRLAYSRIANDTVHLQESTSTWAGLLEASRDPRLWVLVFMHHLHMAASNYKNFFPTIVETLGYSRNVTLALTCPPYLISGIVCIAWAASSGLSCAFFASLTSSIHPWSHMRCRFVSTDRSQIRPFQREGLAHHSREMRRSFRFRSGWQHAQHWCSVFRHVHLCDWCLRL